MSKLTLVPTPIGNLSDITLRAIEVLKEVDVIFAEDTRVCQKLLSHLGIDKRAVPFHAHNEHKSLQSAIERIQSNTLTVLVSDAGTPGISDPGFLLARECIQAGITIECLPGPTAFVPALVASGFPCDKFVFEGFLPHKKGRQTKLTALAEEERTIIFYESPHRLLKTLEQLIVFFGAERQASVARELSKMYEENKRGTLQELLDYFSAKGVKGEIVLVVEGKKPEGKPEKYRKYQDNDNDDDDDTE
jgi:16S rRNA (cytidine1402-2'-O)-methyltransferase